MENIDPRCLHSSSGTPCSQQHSHSHLQNVPLAVDWKRGSREECLIIRNRRHICISQIMQDWTVFVFRNNEPHPMANYNLCPQKSAGQVDSNGSATVNIMVWLRSFVPMQNISTEMLNIVRWLLTYWGVRPHNNNVIVAAAYCTSIPYKSPHSQKDSRTGTSNGYASLSKYIYVVVLLLVEKDRRRCSLQVPPKRSFSICRSMSLLLLLCCTTIYSAMLRRIIMMFLWA